MRRVSTSTLLATLFAALPLAAAQPAPAPATPPAPAIAELETSLRETERAFAATMAKRDLAGFASFLAEDTVFVGGTVRRGKAAVVEGWSRFFEGKEAPFSWEPATAVVGASGTLGLTSGPVYDPDGTRSGTFTSTWRREKDGSWKIVLDTGCPPCDCGAKEK
ncbi:MAG: nuclear transport factor 2 family protein [Holophagales bacterium]|nr:MAG: nuclear transport factor 2 family protein [Holophagales bacterium]